MEWNRVRYPIFTAILMQPTILGIQDITKTGIRKFIDAGSLEIA